MTADLPPEMTEALASLDDALLLQVRPHVGAKALALNDALPNYEQAHERDTVIQRPSTLWIVRKATSDWLRVDR